MTGLICPSKFEYRFLDIAALKKENVSVVQSGMGKVRAAIACHKLRKLKSPIDRILLVGFAGGLTETLRVGDVIEPDVFIEQDYFAEPFEKFPNRIQKRSGKKLLSRSLKSLMLTQDRFLKENPYKNSGYRAKYGRIACDMESYAVSLFCEAEKIPYSVVKLISDTADESADHDFLRSCNRLAPKFNRIVLQAVRAINQIKLKKGPYAA